MLTCHLLEFHKTLPSLQGCCIWSTKQCIFCVKLDKIQYNATSVITVVVKYTSQEKFYKELGLEFLKCRRKPRCLCAFYKIRAIGLPSYKLTAIAWRQYQTRTIEEIRKYQCRAANYFSKPVRYCVRKILKFCWHLQNLSGFKFIICNSQLVKRFGSLQMSFCILSKNCKSLKSDTSRIFEVIHWTSYIVSYFWAIKNPLLNNNMISQRFIVHINFKLHTSFFSNYHFVTVYQFWLYFAIQVTILCIEPWQWLWPLKKAERGFLFSGISSDIFKISFCVSFFIFEEIFCWIIAWVTFRWILVLFSFHLNSHKTKAGVSWKFCHCYFLRDIFDALCGNY